MAYTIGVVCDIGVGANAGGRSRNEDNFLVCQNGGARFLSEEGVERHDGQSGEGVLVAVCDGMGGHDDGDVAAATAVRVLRKLYQPDAPRRPARVLLKYILDSHDQLHQAANKDGAVAMGTTLTVAWLVHGTVAWANVGDSRLYLFRAGDLVQLSSDQTRNEFARRDGRPTTDDGDHLVQNFIYGSRGLGDDPAIRLDHGLDSGAEILHAHDRLLLCTDGVTNALSRDEVCRVLHDVADPQQAAEQLRRVAMERGSRDNITAVVVRVDAVAHHTASAGSGRSSTVHYFRSSD
ncbi:MAG: protein phosphatase 2C domain-containing protein [Myxococcales bacterium]|nr:protein phosphatase 2C domain-containing protein [Myxococcales bacterium]